MDLEDIYPEFPEVQTAEEKEDAKYDLQPGDRPTWFADISAKLLTTLEPVAEFKAAFEKRRPALGMTRAQIEELDALSKNPRLCRPARNRLFQSLRRVMLHQLISTSGASNIGHLCAILMAELESGKPAPVPSWYEFARSNGTPRKIGYAYCATRNCFNTEGPQAKPFPKCAKCQVAVYCGRACQVRDWGERHKVLCKAAKRGRELLAQPTGISPFGPGNRGLLDVADVLPGARAVVSALHPDDPQLQELRLQELNAAFNAGYLGDHHFLDRRRRHGGAMDQRAPDSSHSQPAIRDGVEEVHRGTANTPAASPVPAAATPVASSSHTTTGAAYSHPANRAGPSIATGAIEVRSTPSSSPSLEAEQSFRPAVDLELDLEEDEDAILALQKRVMQNMQHLQNPELLRQSMANPELMQQVMGALDVQLPNDRQLQREIVAAMALRVAAGASGAAGLSSYPAAGPDFGSHQHGHSHGGVPCHGHGHNHGNVAADYGYHRSQPESEHPHYGQQYHHYPHSHTHGHSHGGVPCNGHYIDEDDVDDADDMGDEIDEEEEYLERLHFLVHRRKDLEQRLSELEIERERLQGRANKNRRQKIGKKITKLEKEFIAVEEELEDFEPLDLEAAEAEAERLATRAMAALRDIASAQIS